MRRLPIHLAANAVCGPLPKGSGAQSGAAAEIASCLLLPPAAAGRDPLRKCPSLARISQISTTTGWIKGGEKSPPLSFQLGGSQRGEEIGISSGLPRCHMRAGVKTCPHMAWRHKLNPASFCPRQRQGSIPLACFLFLSTFSWARGHERLPPVSALFRGFLSRLACWASAQRRSLGATIPRKMSAHRCCTVFTEQICDESRRRPRIILSYSQGLQRRVGANLPAKTDRGSSPLAPARAKRKWTLTE